MNKCLSILDFPKDILIYILNKLFGKNARAFMSTCKKLYGLIDDPFERIQFSLGDRNIYPFNYIAIFETTKQCALCFIKCKLDRFESHYERCLNLHKKANKHRYLDDGRRVEYNSMITTCDCGFTGKNTIWFPHLARSKLLPTILTECCQTSISNNAVGCFSCRKFICWKISCALCRNKHRICMIHDCNPYIHDWIYYFQSEYRSNIFGISLYNSSVQVIQNFEQFVIYCFPEKFSAAIVLNQYMADVFKEDGAKKFLETTMGIDALQKFVQNYYIVVIDYRLDLQNRPIVLYKSKR